MTTLDFDAMQVGAPLPPFTAAPVTRATLALYAGASGDHNPIHIDRDYAAAIGMGDVFSHGMLIMAYLGRLLTAAVPQSALRKYGVRFVSITRLQDRITCSGRLLEKLERNGERMVRLELIAVNQDGDLKLTGEALLAIP